MTGHLKKREPDFVILFTTVTLLLVGLVMVFSASAIIEGQRQGDIYFQLRRQALWAVIGFAGLLFFSRYDYWKLRRWTNLFLLANLLLLLAVFVPGLGFEAGGAQRWIRIGGLTMQPAELTKVAMVLFASAYLSRKEVRIQNFLEGVFPVLAVLSVFFLLILRQPNLGTAIAIAGTTSVIVFVAGMPLRQLAVAVLAGVPLLGYLMISAPYRLERLLSFRDPWADPLDTGFQVIQSFYALGSGGLFGAGLGRSRQKLFYIPEPQNDFIFAIIGEELGFIGASAVLFLFLLLLWRGFKVALQARDVFGSLLAAGFISMIGLQTLVNVAVVTGSIPVTGTNLPLISAGGSSLFVTMCGIGVVLNISRYIKAD
ncbi:MAG: putative peptidoglycan glycosyltransferase FtsW [Syntrophomonadaceae bacterium]|nr:putative peptidoglycan glycosyltransferase FtsW [Bacillota bacterium]